jgi:uracil-DNA glycosylase
MAILLVRLRSRHRSAPIDRPSEYATLSQQNTFTGKLTPAMLRGVLERAKDLAGLV